MLKIYRVCIPLGMNCNFRCQYCYRELTPSGMPTELNNDMRTYLKTLDKSWCQEISLGGGEPTLYFSTIKEIFSLVKDNVQKRVFTNGSLLTQEMVDYFNQKKVEIVLSHDGAMTKFLRGRDVLTEPKQLGLIKQIDMLSVFCVCTKYNTDIIANYEDTVQKLGRENIFYVPSPVYNNSRCGYLIDGFDYDEFARTYREYRNTIYFPFAYVSLDDEYKHNQLNILLDGSVVDRNTLVKYGTVWNTCSECIKAKNDAFKSKYCMSSDCPIKGKCKAAIESASDHYCKCIKIMEGYE